SLVAQFRYLPAKVGQLIQTYRFANQLFSHPLGIKGRILRNIVVNVTKLDQCVIGPLYHA
ncbi:MAG: hypothetical protein CTY19_18480, partial [Methylomonas sp.]